MKKFTFLIGMMLVTSIVFGQVNLKSYRQSTVPGTQIGTDKVLTGTLDTLWQYYTRATGFFVYNAGSYGYIAPSNSFSTETGMEYSFTGSAKVEQLLMWFGHKQQMGASPCTTTAEVYNAGAADSLPSGTVLGTATFTTADVDTTGAFTVATFTTPPSITGSFVVAITGMSTTNVDTLGLVCNDPTTDNGNHEKRLKAHLVAAYGGVWKSLNTIFTGGFDADMMMIPVILTSTGIPVISNDLTLSGIYPNPARSDANINFSVSNNTKVNIKIFDVCGRVYYKVNEVMSAGNHILHVDLSNMSNGTYYYTVSTSKGTLTSKFEVIK